MNFVTKGIICFLAMIPSVVLASGYGAKDITDYEQVFVGYDRFPAAQSQLLKAVQKDGKREAANLTVERFLIGARRERYDNKYSYIAGYYAESKSGEKSIVDGSEAELSDQYGFIYGSGVHISESVDWSLFVEVSTGKMTVDGESESNVGVGLGTELLFGITNHFDIGMSVLVSRHYNTGGLSLKINF